MQKKEIMFPAKKKAEIHGQVMLKILRKKKKNLHTTVKQFFFSSQEPYTLG